MFFFSLRGVVESSGRPLPALATKVATKIPLMHLNPRHRRSFSSQGNRYKYKSSYQNKPAALIMSFFIFYWKSLACRFLVMEGSFTRRPSNSLVMSTWQPRRLVSVRPNARSSMSFSSSSGSGILSKYSSSRTITWQVEQAQEPPHAPSISKSCA